MQLTKEIKHIFNSLHDYGVWQHEQAFPWMDSFAFFKKDTRDNYYTSTPEYQDHKEEFHKFFDTIGQKEWGINPVEIIFAKQTDRGIHIPQKNTSIIWALKGDIKLLVCENRDRLNYVMAIHDYDLFNWSNRKITLNIIKEGDFFVIGNRFAHALHMEEGQEVIHARYG